MSRTDKDTPYWVREVRGDTYPTGCPGCNYCCGRQWKRPIRRKARADGKRLVRAEWGMVSSSG